MLNEVDPKVDEVLEDYVVPHFLQQQTRSIKINAETLRDKFNNEYGNLRITAEFQKRGFVVNYKCEDRPCGSCWFIISLPPDDE